MSINPNSCILQCTKNEVLIKNFFSKCDQIFSFLGIFLHLEKKSLMTNFIFCTVLLLGTTTIIILFRWEASTLLKNGHVTCIFQAIWWNCSNFREQTNEQTFKYMWNLFKMNNLSLCKTSEFHLITWCETSWKSTVSAEFQAIRSKFRNYAFYKISTGKNMWNFGVLRNSTVEITSSPTQCFFAFTL